MPGLLLDQNLSHRIVAGLKDLFPGSRHVREVGLSRADDVVVWTYARDSGLAIVTKDRDFHQMAFLYGPPPKVVWLRTGNCSTDDALGLLRGSSASIIDFIEAGDEALLVVNAFTRSEDRE